MVSKTNNVGSNPAFSDMNNIITLNPTISSMRKASKIKRVNFIKSKLIKNLSEGSKYRSGRCIIRGNITVRHKGMKQKKRKSLLIKHNAENRSIVICEEYNSLKRSNLVTKFDFYNKKFFYELSTQASKSGILSQTKSILREYKSLYKMMVNKIPIGSLVSAVGNVNKQTAVYSRSAGSSSVILNNIDNKTLIKLPSGKKILIQGTSYAILGSMSNFDSQLIRLGKAGMSRFLGKRPTVRGIAMNPVDHPHGGRTNGGIPSKSPWGLPTKSGFRLKKHAK